MKVFQEALLILVLIHLPDAFASRKPSSLLSLLAKQNSVQNLRKSIKNATPFPDFNHKGGKTDEAKMTSLEIIEYYGYPNEKHTITTEDGYNLELHRIPNPGKPPVLLGHGVLSSSADFLLLGPNKSLSFMLYNNGYDVWLINYRGNRYSRSHVSLNPDSDKEFWNFSMHEIGVHDLSATVNHVLNVSGHDRLYYLGHSMGTTIFWILLSQKPEFNDKIHFMQALAPAAFLNHVKSDLLNNLIDHKDTIQFFMNLFGVNEVLPHGIWGLSPLCSGDLNPICIQVIQGISGHGVSQWDEDTVDKLFGHFPAGASLKIFIHWAQCGKNKNLSQYDYGSAANVVKYNKTTPPEYNLANCKVPLALHYGSRDTISSVEDVKLLSTKLPKVEKMNELLEYTHTDFLYANSAPSSLYDEVLQIFSKHRKLKQL